MAPRAKRWRHGIVLHGIGWQSHWLTPPRPAALAQRLSDLENWTVASQKGAQVARLVSCR
eukprot:CAMPEP_0198547420 /NCGR_PEP_ID=MMETSP1462-20131121/67547_1 /TAXON_ID=1333877 /ORGANISM="Brandtodinium nutriculum, Strain RCC3387" /LENGTH=59 /DNA_ID=CAMNT_0044277909 /DNA_START=51 /DNA_END=230 /DNA_ORIENTATION=+